MWVLFDMAVVVAMLIAGVEGFRKGDNVVGSIAIAVAYLAFTRNRK